MLTAKLSQMWIFPKHLIKVGWVGFFSKIITVCLFETQKLSLFLPRAITTTCVQKNCLKDTIAVVSQKSIL